MDADAPYKEQMDNVVNIVQSVGHSIENVQTNDDGEPVVAYANTQGNISYMVLLTKDELPYVIVRYKYDLVYDLSGKIMSRQGALDSDDNPEIKMEKGMKEIATVMSEERDTYFGVMEEVGDRLNTKDAYYTIERDDTNVLRGFTVSRNVYVTEENFSLEDFDEAVRAVVSIGTKARKFLGEQFGIRSRQSVFSSGVLSDPRSDDADSESDDSIRGFS